jgi:hypothetical protein
MEIKILSHEEVEFKERDIQNAFEHDLSKLEEGLTMGSPSDWRSSEGSRASPPGRAICPNRSR